MNAYQISQIIALALAIAVLVILIVVLTRNTLTKVPVTNDLEEGAKKITMLDNKVNWLYALEIASVGIMILFGLIGFFGYMRWNTCA